jgi:haloalkane dehalogenase
MPSLPGPPETTFSASRSSQSPDPAGGALPAGTAPPPGPPDPPLGSPLVEAQTPADQADAARQHRETLQKLPPATAPRFVLRRGVHDVLAQSTRRYEIAPGSTVTMFTLRVGRNLMSVRPAWVDDQLFPYESHFIDVAGARVHYIDEGDGPVFLGLHGNPTWSFLYRHVVNGLKDRFRCIALDYPGFGLSTAPTRYGYTIAEHARVVEGFVEQLDLRDVTLMVQDWGGPIGFWVASRHQERFRAFVVGNTWAWPVTGDRAITLFSKLLGSANVGGLLVRRADIFVNLFMRGGIKRKKLTAAEHAMYKQPHPTPESRLPVHVMPREILGAHDLLAEVEQGLERVSGKPALIVWGDKDPGFKVAQLRRWERIFPNHRTVILRGASHYIQEDAPDEIIAAIKAWWPGE